MDAILDSVTDSLCKPPKLRESLNVSASFTLPLKVEYYLYYAPCLSVSFASSPTM